MKRDGNIWTIQRWGGLTNANIVKAYSVAELGEILPVHGQYGVPVSGKCNGGKEYACNYFHFGNLFNDKERYEREKLNEAFVANTEADARAKMLIYLLENDLM